MGSHVHHFCVLTTRPTPPIYITKGTYTSRNLLTMKYLVVLFLAYNYLHTEVCPFQRFTLRVMHGNFLSRTQLPCQPHISFAVAVLHGAQKLAICRMQCDLPLLRASLTILVLDMSAWRILRAVRWSFTRAGECKASIKYTNTCHTP